MDGAGPGQLERWMEGGWDGEKEECVFLLLSSFVQLFIDYFSYLCCVSTCWSIELICPGLGGGTERERESLTFCLLINIKCYNNFAA